MLSQATALNSLGILRQLTGDYPAAAGALAEALNISHNISDQPGQINALTGMGTLRQLTGDFPRRG